MAEPHGKQTSSSLKHLEDLRSKAGADIYTLLSNAELFQQLTVETTSGRLTDEWTNKMWDTCMQEYYSARKRGFWQNSKTWRSLLSEIKKKKNHKWKNAPTPGIWHVKRSKSHGNRQQQNQKMSYEQEGIVSRMLPYILRDEECSRDCLHGNIIELYYAVYLKWLGW